VQSGAHILDVMAKGTVRARALLAAQTDEARGKIAQFIDDVLKRHPGKSGGADVPLPAVVGGGVKA
jgi:hypothetical protein